MMLYYLTVFRETRRHPNGRTTTPITSLRSRRNNYFRHHQRRWVLNPMYKISYAWDGVQHDISKQHQSMYLSACCYCKIYIDLLSNIYNNNNPYLCLIYIHSTSNNLTSFPISVLQFLHISLPVSSTYQQNILGLVIYLC